MICLRSPIQMWVVSRIKRPPLWVTPVRACWLANVACEPIFSCTVLQELLLGLVKTDVVGTSRHERVSKLKLIIFPEANRANGVTARRFAEHQVAANGARKGKCMAHGMDHGLTVAGNQYHTVNCQPAPFVLIRVHSWFLSTPHPLKWIRQGAFLVRRWAGGRTVLSRLRPVPG
jgi:hypothetical protein